MKNIYLTLLFLSTTLFAQDFEKKWTKVIEFENEGKIKSANELVDKIYKKATSKKDETQIIKCFFYKSKYIQVLEEDAQSKILVNLNTEINRASIPSQAILNLVYAKCLTDYLKKNYNVHQRTQMDSTVTGNFLTWTNNDFVKEITKTYEKSLSNETILKRTSLSNYEPIFDFLVLDKFKNQTLFEYVLKENIYYYHLRVYEDEMYKREFRKYEKSLIGSSDDFIKLNFDFVKNENLQKTLTLFQKLESSNPTEENQLERIEFCATKLLKNEIAFLHSLNLIQKKSKDLIVSQNIQLQKAKILNNLASKEVYPDYNIKAIAILDSIISIKNRSNAYKSALVKKQEITSKYLNIKLQKYVYPSENSRAFVDYKNVDKITISIYKINQKEFLYFENGKYKKDSLFAVISKKRPLKTSSNTLINKKNYFNYTTEILLPSLETGSYLVHFESDSFDEIEKAFAYQTITVSNFTILAEEKNRKEYFHVLDRKTGKPIKDARLRSFLFDIKTDENGLAIYEKNDEKRNFANIELSKENDTINIDKNYLNQTNDYSIDDEEENFRAKVEFYLDRAIYRPGQTVYYKGIAFQKKQNKKSVIPNLTLKIKVEDADNNNFKEFEVTTNEFGSFSGEFVLPKNGLTGEFRIKADEPDDFENDPLYNKKEDKHPFWDDVDFEYSDLRFSVEEYKRPKFEVTFEPVKESYIVKQKINVTGNAKAFSGSNVSDAKVKYTVTRSVYQTYRNYYDANKKVIVTSETKTDAKGKFNINFEALPDDETDKTNLPIYHYKINADITDINGETRSSETIVKVGYHSLMLSAKVPKIIHTKDKNSIQINSTNLNGEFVATQGEIKIYFINKPSDKFKPRVWDKPEIDGITDEQFNILFPYERNEKVLTGNETGILVYSKKVDTQKEKIIPMEFLSKYESGYYKIVFSAIDKFNNPIENTSKFELIQDENKVNKYELFTIEQVNKDPKKDGFVTLKLTSTLPELYLLAIGNYKSNTFFEESISLKSNQATIKIPLNKEFENSVKIGFQSIFENEQFQDEFEVLLKTSIPKMQFEVESFRNKIEPGSKENWSFKLNAENTLREAEVLASMYDSSLDQFANEYWRDLKIDDYDYNSIDFKTSLGFQKTNVSIQNLNNPLLRFERNNEESKLIWFGFDFNNSDNNSYFAQREYKQQLEKKNKKPLDAKMISGIVSDATGGLPGANVVVKGTTRGVQTDFDGYYEIEAAEGETLVYSFLGMTDTSQIIGKFKIIDVVMQGNNMRLESVVVTAFGIRKKKDAMTYSTQVVTRKELIQSANENIIQSLTGKVSGVQINTDTSGNTRIVLRGSRTLPNNNGALIVIDGVISTANVLQEIFPDDIVSINVLKAEQGIALYGEQGAGGVIIVSTQKALQELTKVKPRTNLSETAFFFPHLKTDPKGKISFNFTSPEALTSWKMRLFAHNKNTVVGYLEKTIITQKDLMVIPNFPRFFREKDTITITTKISNVTSETKTGIAVLQLFNASTMEAIDVKTLNANNIKNFNIPAFGNTTVSWKIFIPEGLQGIQYKVLAKAGNFSDGEENILPVLTNNILVTESIPIWVKVNSKKEYAFENLKNNTSTTLRNHQLTLEYTSNPTWLAIQSLPYLMEYEHECAEQTFSRFYANALATEIINSNPKIAAVFETWRKNGKLNSKLEQNEELKSIILAETPWLNDAQNEEEKKKNLALLFDLEKMKDSQDAIFEKLIQKQKPSGGFPWFDGGNESEYITRHILAGFGHLKKLNVKTITKEKIAEIAKTGISFIDKKFIEIHEKEIKNQTQKAWLNPNSDLHYLYTRSFYLVDYPLSDNLKNTIKIYLELAKANWLTYSLYEKGMTGLALHRFGETETAKKILENLKETASNNEDWGMYWIGNKSGWYWYQAPIETQALLIEAFAEINNDNKSVDAMKVWLLKNKQNKNWPTTKATTEAVYALLLQGTDWTSVKDNTIIKVGDEKIVTKKLSENEKEAETGYLKLTWKKEEINSKMANLTIENKSKVPGYGGFYWQYFEDLDKIKTNSGSALSVAKELYLKTTTIKGEVLQKITSNNPLKIGDLITVRLIITTKEDMEYVHLKDMRASCFEPINVLSEYKWNDNLDYYMSTKDAATHFFFDEITKGTYVIEYDIRVNNIGDFSNGITTIQSMYAPEFTSHTKGIRVKTKEE